MDFIDKIKQYSKRIEMIKDSLSTEEATKTALIMPFFNLLEQSLLLFCESGSELCFKPHNGYKRSAFVCAVCYVLHCFF